MRALIHLNIILLILFVFTGTQAQQIELKRTKIFQIKIISAPQGPGEESVVVTDHDRAFNIPPDKGVFLERIKQAMADKIQLYFTYESIFPYYLHNVEFRPDWPMVPYNPLPYVDLNFKPDVVSEQEALDLFKEMRSPNKRQELCTQRAHIWAYDFWRQKGLKTQKIFLFYTKRYRNREDWWFHVSPYLLVKGENGQIKEWVMDWFFFPKPMEIKEWSESFVKNGNCPIAKNHLEYLRNVSVNSRYLCFLRKDLSMYFYQPVDILRFDSVHNVIPQSWFKKELERSMTGFDMTAEEKSSYLDKI